jgi:hypothetical protein
MRQAGRWSAPTPRRPAISPARSLREPPFDRKHGYARRPADSSRHFQLASSNRSADRFDVDPHPLGDVCGGQEVVVPAGA